MHVTKQKNKWQEQNNWTYTNLLARLVSESRNSYLILYEEYNMKNIYYNLVEKNIGSKK